VRLSDAEFAELAELLRRTAGLAFDRSRRDSLSYAIGERMRALECDDVAAYLQLVAGEAGIEERQALLDDVTVPETHFFRNPPQVRALRTHVLPELLRQAAPTKRLRIWSAGCSTGEEPYTLAMLVRELLPVSSGWDVRIIASDLSTRALARARDARYGERSLVMTDDVDRQRFFILDAAAGSWNVRDEVRELVEFRHHNLVTDPPVLGSGHIDLVLCRNVTIYFDTDTTRALVERLHGCLRDGGYLFLGHAETLWHVTDVFALVPLGDAFVYRRESASGERRRVLPDRRTAHEPHVRTRDEKAGPDRRRGPADRRLAALAEGPARPVTTVVGPDPVGPDPVDAVRAALDAGRYAEAADLAADLAAVTPLRQAAHYLRGLALTNLGRDREAIAALRKAVYLDPADGFAHFLLAGALERCGEVHVAARSYRTAADTLGRRPRDAVAPELGGRSVLELAELCGQLAELCGRGAERTGRADEGDHP
jgi:chemotaxis protein methyltransferase CheR